MTEYIVALLKDENKVAVLSRGYGRKTKGYVLADAAVDASVIGDEPFQIFSKFKNSIQVAVNENRREGIEQLRKLEPTPEVIVLDDAFQHRKVTAGFYILLTAYGHLYVDDYILPTGNLREPIAGAKRANMIVVTKCPEHLTEAKKIAIKERLKLLPQQALFFSSIQYSNTVYSNKKTLRLQDLAGKKISLVTGIANSKSLTDFLSSNNLDFEHLNYKDHHIFTESELKMLHEKSLILTTEKDYARLASRMSHEHLFYLPIRTKIDRQEQFDAMVRNFIAGN